MRMRIPDVLVTLLEAGGECKPAFGAILAWLGGVVERSPIVTSASTDGLDMPLTEGMRRKRRISPVFNRGLVC